MTFFKKKNWTIQKRRLIVEMKTKNHFTTHLERIKTVLLHFPQTFQKQITVQVSTKNCLLKIYQSQLPTFEIFLNQASPERGSRINIDPYHGF